MRSGYVVAGGVLGTLARWGIESAFPATPPAFPWATLIVNVTGAFGLGAIATIAIERLVHSSRLRTFAAIGLFGSYTSFSTMALEWVRLLDSGRIGYAAAYWVATLVLGQMAGVYGMWLGRLGHTEGRRDESRR
jgi:CrcB protein